MPIPPSDPSLLDSILLAQIREAREELRGARSGLNAVRLGLASCSTTALSGSAPMGGGVAQRARDAVLVPRAEWETGLGLASCSTTGLLGEASMAGGVVEGARDAVRVISAEEDTGVGALTRARQSGADRGGQVVRRSGCLANGELVGGASVATTPLAPDGSVASPTRETLAVDPTPALASEISSPDDEDGRRSAEGPAALLIAAAPATPSATPSSGHASPGAASPLSDDSPASGGTEALLAQWLSSPAQRARVREAARSSASPPNSERRAAPARDPLVWASARADGAAARVLKMGALRTNDALGDLTGLTRAEEPERPSPPDDKTEDASVRNQNTVRDASQGGGPHPSFSAAPLSPHTHTGELSLMQTLSQLEHECAGWSIVMSEAAQRMHGAGAR